MYRGVQLILVGNGRMTMSMYQYPDQCCGRLYINTNEVALSIELDETYEARQQNADEGEMGCFPQKGRHFPKTGW
jgi:hypothetical protein